MADSCQLKAIIMKAGRILIINLVLLILVLIFIFLAGLFLSREMNVTQAAGEDKQPPSLSNIKIAEIGATTTRVIWNTDEDSDSLVNYGWDKNLGMAREPHFDKKTHEVVLDGLEPNTTYYFRVTSADQSGNQGISSDFSFTTAKDGEYQKGTTGVEPGQKGATGDSSGAKGDSGEGTGQAGTSGEESGQKGDTGEETGFSQPNDNPENDAKGTGPGQNVLVREILEKVDQLKSETALQQIMDQVQAVSQDVASDLTILLDVAQVDVGTDYAIVTWKTNKEANTVVNLVEDERFNAALPDPYRWSEGHPNETVLDHRVEITGLRPATTYHYQVYSQTSLGQKAISKDNTFRTKSVLPEIFNVAVSKVEENSATISFVTNIPTSAMVDYTNLTNRDNKLAGDTNFMTVHTVKLNDLIFDTYYSAIIRVENEQGDKAASDPITFLTTRDKLPPLISKVNTESTLYPGSDNKVQTIISWESDEQAKCQLFYQQGIAANEGPMSQPLETDFLARHVQVITNFLPATVYKFWVVCRDDADNEGRSQDFTMLTPSQEESIIDIILKNFEGTFGWLKKVKT